MMTRWFAILSFVLAAACSQSSGFQGSSGTAPSRVPEPLGTASPQVSADSSVAGVPKHQMITLGSSTPLVDLVWVIDNSQSMDGEAAQVRSNVSKFIASVALSTDLRLALISQSTGPTGVQLGSEAIAKGHLQLETPVGSTNLLAIAAAASCAENQSTFISQANPPVGSITVRDDTMVYSKANVRVCGRDFDLRNNTFDSTAASRSYLMESPDAVVSSRGRLVSFFRPTATRIYVFVTDDDAGMVNDLNFLELLGAGGKGPRPSVFAFRGIESNAIGCTISMRGRSYETLASRTGAEVYDICLADWSAHFKKLSESVGRIAKVQYDLSEPGLRVEAIKLDGVVLATNLWRVEASRLILSPDALLPQAKELEVVYASP